MVSRGSAPPALVRVTRGGLVESLHRGSIVVADASGRQVAALGNPDEVVFLRSAAKPPQALPVIETGAADRFGLTPEEIAVMCGSLNGQDFQVAAVRSILNKVGLEPTALDCGIHRPSHRPTARAMSQAGEKPTELHNNCAGKHAAMLVLCVHHDWPIEGYTESDHPVQRLILNRIAELTDVPAEQIGLGIDGCGVPVFALPLKNLALAYARMAEAAASSKPEAMARLMSAMLSHAEMIAGDERICTEAMRVGQGRFLAKTGAEGTYALALPDRGWGVALSLEDGHARGVNPVVVETLVQLGQLSREEAARLAAYHHPVIRNHRGEEVGFSETVFDLKIQ
ncbi:MAG: asparaginase [Deltaproteobacteria bacterium]|nr:asparaginase [Deltaproteobacteria bacterium]